MAARDMLLIKKLKDSISNDTFIFSGCSQEL